MIASEEDARAFCSQRCDAAAMHRLEEFVALLTEENGRQNLVADATLPHVWQRHIADSLQLLDHVSRETSEWLDLGSGAGLPGAVIALARPDLPISLVESRKRRIEWLSRVVDHFALAQCKILGARIENISAFPAEVITARAFAPLPKLLTLSARFSTRSTVWLLPKGRSGRQELEAQPIGVRQLFHVEQSQTDPDAAILVGRGRPNAP